MDLPVRPTTVVGSMPQPDWLIDREGLKSRLPPRVRARELWRVPEPWLQEAQDAATLMAIRAQELAGIDIVSDGEIRRESYSNHLATALSGIDIDNPGSAMDRTGKANPVPRIVGPIRRTAPLEVKDMAFLRANARGHVKITLPGPFTMAQQAQNDFYPDDAALAMDYATAVNAEVRELFAAGADIVQLDEPYLEARPAKAREYAIRAINRALEGVPGRTALHICFGYAYVHQGAAKPASYSFLEELDESKVDIVSLEAAQPGIDLSILKRLPSKTIMLGVIDLDDPDVETPEVVARRIRAALEFVPPERLMLAPDCGMKYIPAETALAKLRALVAGTAIVRRDLD